MVSGLSDRKEGAFLYIKKPTCPKNEVVYLVTMRKLKKIVKNKKIDE